ncbi:TRAP transporter small permease [Pelagibacterium luteolum]|uniref:TRAP transporter small permease protein n=1 Tax=Pelagibacterium luteolum TaxID=440168 RepID=A0A1G7YHG7_9HYPH|nr:TRAP transporter small permease [Pelagibacterium luteolum]SDG95933.1 TRAP-type C4-dicarboxylate transport system, small permease component [Pelagibacterium luteolum]
MFQDNSPLGRSVYGLAKGLALLGGVVMVAVIIMITLSIIGRTFIWAGLRPILGDYELSSMGIAFTVFTFLPWAHLERGHAIVTLITDRFGPRFNAWLLVITDAMMLATAAFIAWRLYDGMLDKFAFRETTLLLRVPLGWAYAAAFVGASVFVIVAIYVLGRSVTNAVTGRTEPDRAGAEI